MISFEDSQRQYREWKREQPARQEAAPSFERRQSRIQLVKVGVPCPTQGQSLISKAVSAATVLGSPKVPEDVLAERNEHCRRCDYVHETTDGRLFCRCCGCPASGLSEVTNKNKYAAAFCPGPHQAFGPWEEAGRNGIVASAIRAGVEVAKSLI